MISGTIFKFLRRGPVVEKIVHATSTTSAKIENLTSISSDVKPFSEMPGPKGIYSIPYLGTAFLFKPFTRYSTSDLLCVLKNMRNKYGDLVKIRIGKNYQVYVFHPDYAKTVFQFPYKIHIKMPLDLIEVFSKRTNSSKSLTLLDGKEWEALRKPAQEKMLRPAIVASYVPLIGDVTNDLVELLRKKDKIDDLQAQLFKYTTESIGMLCFNKRLGYFDSNVTPKIVEYIQEMFAIIQTSFTSVFKTFKYFRTPLYRRFEKTRVEFSKVVNQEILQQRNMLKRLEKDGKLEEYLEKEPNFMYSLLSDPRMTVDKVDNIVSTLFGAGIDSTANSMVFALTDLALNPDKQAKLYDEVHRVLGDNKVMTQEHLAQMTYLKACIKESQRKTFPVLIGTLRTMETDVVLGGYSIPKGTVVQMDMEAMTSDERFFPRPNEYIPERWLRDTNDEIAKGQDYPFGMKPFGFGPRGCIGQRFAEMELYIGVTKIIQNFQISMPPGVSDVKSVMRTFTSPADTVVLQLKDRKNTRSG